MKKITLMTVLFLIIFVMPLNLVAQDNLRVLHNKIDKANYQEAVTIKVNIINMHLVNYVILHYKNINDKIWSQKEMTPKKGLYSTNILPKDIGDIGLVYYIEVIDSTNNSIKGFAEKEKPQYINIIKKGNTTTLFDSPELLGDEKKDRQDDFSDEFEVFIDNYSEEKVVTASKYAQSRFSAPANISIVTAKDIKEYGYHSLLEILRDNGFDVNDNGSWADVGLRGINDRTTYGKYLLIFIDGHNMSFTQFYRNIISKGLISLEDIKRIEIQKGPGSSIWGANALQGVINIVTKNYDSKNAVTLTSGTHDTFSSHARVVKNINKNVSIFASVMTYQDDISKDMIIKEWSKGGDEVTLNNMSQHSYTFFEKMKLWDFNISSYYNRYDPYAALTTFSTGGDDTRLVTDRFYNSLNYDKEVFKNKDLSWSINATVSHDRYNFANGAQYEDNPYSNPNYECELVDDGNGGQEIECGKQFIRKMKALDDRYEAKIFTTLNLMQFNTTLLLGFDYERLETIRWYYPEVFTASNIETPELSQNNMGAFLQAEVNLIDMISIVAGARYDKNSIYKAQLSPKASLVITPGDFFFKAIWGQGFKAPSLHELYYFRKNAYYGNPLLEPETSDSFEIQAGYNKKGFLSIELTFFKSDISNVIGYSKKDDINQFDVPAKFPDDQLPTTSYNQQANKSEYRTMGGELFVKIIPMKELYFTLRAGYNIAERAGVNGAFVRDNDGSYSTTELETSDQFYRLDYGQQYFAAFGINYKLLKKFNFNISGRYTSNKLVPFRNYSEPGNQYNEETDSTLATDPYFVLNLGFFAEDVLIEGFNIALKVDDVLNQQYYDAGREVLYPQTALRFFATIQYKF